MYNQYTISGADPTQRSANTAETYDLFLEHTSAKPGGTALLITSAIYVPHQHLDATRVLGVAGLEIETVGLIANEPRRHSARAYRQEIRSTLRSIEVCLATGQSDEYKA